MPRRPKRKTKPGAARIPRSSATPPNPQAPTHADLVAAAARWLGDRCAVVITEMCAGSETSGEEPDAIGWRYTRSILIECKASLTDFRVDKDKPFRQSPEKGIGRFRYYLAPSGLIKQEMLPPQWGLLEMTGNKVRKVREAEEFEIHNHAHETSILLAALRHTGRNAPEGVSIHCYAMHTQKATLGVNGGDDPLDMPWTALSVTCAP